ncbi:unnamed protein product [Effrenium voratum]|uniref:Uncharacterized protein n=1 Tax=Effrenium voratum TaxID=2562239 RepID=A0AA36IS12_9DINO|nr:unnamed protein product [Effrenium voratum]
MRLVAALTLWLVRSQEDAATAPAAFERFGDGECMTSAMLPVRGRSRRDMEHGECRAVCNTDNCIGYTYAPCERICSLHGEPELFRGLPEVLAWSTLNGGGLIAKTSQQCGASCYVRKAPCQGGTLQSAGAFMNYEALTYAMTRTLECPFPHKGTVTIECTSTGIQVAGGRCLRPCESGFVRDAFFEVKFPPTRHGEFGAGPCPTGTLGNMTIFCNDGSATHVLGRCGTNCPAGSMRSGTSVIYYPVMDHEDQMTIQCPEGYVGSVLLECVNAFTYVREGACKQHCLTGRVNTTVGAGDLAVAGYVEHQRMLHDRGTSADCQSPDDMLQGRLILFCEDGNVSADYALSRCFRHCAPGQIGTGVRAVSHGIIEHNRNQTLQCNPGFDGDFQVSCNDGTVIHVDGFCYMNCVPGTITSNTITLPHEALAHGQNTTVECPIDATHRGNITVLCDDGQARMRIEGFCGENCSSGEILSNGARVQYPGIPHGFHQNISCPAPWGDQIEFRCYDGSVRYEGMCGRQCMGGRLDQNGAAVFYTNLNHSQVGNFSCDTLYQSTLTFSGSLELTCIDGSVISLGQCFPDCPDGAITNNGARILVPPLKAGDSTMTNCEPAAAYGIVRVSCLEGFQVVTQGSCGDPCPAAPFSNVNTRHTSLDLEEVWHDTGVWKEDCPEDLSGQVYIHCFDRVLRVLEGQCGERCQSQRLEVDGAKFLSPVLDHAETFLQPCIEPYSDFVNLTCIFGELHVTSNCRLGCFANTTVLPGGAQVPYPNLVSGYTSQPACPPGFVGSVTLICDDGSIKVHSGACNSHCAAGLFQGPSGYFVSHLEIQYNETRLLRLRCLGTVVIEEGECPRNCLEGAMLVRSGVIMPHTSMEHGEVSNERKCPVNFVGSIRLRCSDSVVSVASGQCYEHCGYGQVQGAEYRNLEHEAYVSIMCPEVGQIKIKCLDGVTEVLEGECLYGCQKGTIPDPNGVPLQFPSFPHGTKINGTCSNLGVGQVELICNNTAVSVVSGACLRHCPPQSTQSRDGSNISTPYIEHLQQDAVECPAPLPGTLALYCNDYVTTVFDGVCGDMNCPEGEITSNGAVVQHPAINDQRRAGPGSCGENYLGQPVFTCDTGKASVLAVNLIRQPRIPGVDNVSQKIGSDYNFTEEDRFKLCGCCLPPPSRPDVDALQGVDSLVIIYWAVGVGGASLLLASAAGYWIHKKRPPKVSQVSPEMAENPNSELALRDAAAGEMSLYESRQRMAPRPSP